MSRIPKVANERKYRLKTVSKAKEVALSWLKIIELEKAVCLGLPEVDDRYHIWRVPLKKKNTSIRIGEVVIDAFSTLIEEEKTTKREILETRLLGRDEKKTRKSKRKNDAPKISSLRNTVALGDCEEILSEMPSESVDLMFTSPPYYNARPEYADYLSYEEYLLKIRKVLHQAHKVLNEGRFFIMNVSPVLIRRTSRNESSKRIAVPFDIHRLFIEENYEFVDDIIWLKPEGAGWATGRGRRFSADRNPLQYKPVPVTEYVLVYRKKTEKLIDWHIRKHPDKVKVKKSKIRDGYEVTNIWKISPTSNKKHPAIFPSELAEKVITYYSFIGDVVLDPFAGIGTVGKAACKLSRRFVLIEINPEYIEEIKRNMGDWLGKAVEDVIWMNCDPAKPENMYFF